MKETGRENEGETETDRHGRREKQRVKERDVKKIYVEMEPL